MPAPADSEGAGISPARAARRLAPAVALILWLAAGEPAAAFFGTAPPHSSIVKIYATIQEFDYSLPWQAGPPIRASGSGFVIRRNRILTNAHVVSNTRYIEVQKEGDPKRYPAVVAFAGHDCDLAILEVPDAAFFKGTRPLVIGDRLPELNDEVTVLGYPMGGTRISVTRGVISRIDYSGYSHSGVDMHLVMQVDAAINPGNSGGPVMYRGKVAGMAFQVLPQGQNIGYAIPIPVLRHFIEDVGDGTYNGYPELGVAYLPLRNPALRRDRRLPDGLTGVVAYYVDPYGSARGRIRTGDVLLSVDGHPIAPDGTIQLDGNSMEFSEMLERKQWGESVLIRIWRDGAELALTVPLTNPPDPFTFRNVYDRKPEYVVWAGLVFAPLSSEYLRTLGPALAQPENQHLLYCSQFAKIDGLYRDRDEFVVLINRLAHPVNTYSEDFVNGIVSKINDCPVRRLDDLNAAFRQMTNRYAVIRFENRPDVMVLDAEKTDGANAGILSAYGVPSPACLEARPAAGRPSE